MKRMDHFKPMIQQANTKEIFKQNIMELNVEELRSFIEKPEILALDSGITPVLSWMILQGENIPDFEKKFKTMVTYYQICNPMLLEGLPAYACSCLRESSLSTLIEASCNIHTENISGQNECLVAAFYPYKNLKTLPKNKNKIEQLQKNIIKLLIQNEIRLDLLKKNEHNDRSFYESLCNAKQHYFLDWIESFYDEFNEEQKKEWKVIRLQRLF